MQFLRRFLSVPTAFWKGYGSLIDLSGNLLGKERSKNAATNMSSDWKKIGNDLRWSFQEYGTQRGRKSSISK